MYGGEKRRLLVEMRRKGERMMGFKEFWLTSVSFETRSTSGKKERKKNVSNSLIGKDRGQRLS
jgi:hypothetical protein